MIRALYAIAAPLLGRAGAAVLHAARAESDRADTAEWNEAHTQGAFDASKHYAEYLLAELTESRETAWEAGKRARRLESEIETLRSELASLSADDDCAVFSREAIDDAKRELQRECNASRSLSIRLGQATEERDELQRRCDALSARIKTAEEDARQTLASGAIGAARFGEIHGKMDEADKRAEDCRAKLAAAESRIADMAARLDQYAVNLRSEVDRNYQSTAQINTARARVRELEEQVDAMADTAAKAQRELAAARATVAPVEAEAVKCAWCLGDLGTSPYECEEEALCGRCYNDDSITWASVRARVATRAASCASRRTSPDPLAIDCVLGCGAPVGTACDVSAEQ